MRVYLASPGTQQQAEHVADMPVLLSFATYSEWLDRYWTSFAHVLIDSGAYSEFNSGKKIDVSEYADWCQRWTGLVDAMAGVDDISGDWRRSLENYQKFPDGFPTIHDSDPGELLKDLVQLSLERTRWIGIGLVPPRESKERFIRWVCDNVPEGIHVHGWACRRYTHIPRIDSVDSTNWWRDAMKLRTLPALSHLTYGECLDIIVKRYKRWERRLSQARESQSAIVFPEES